MFIGTLYLILIIIAVAIFLIFFGGLLPNWVCNYIGHHKPTDSKVSGENSDILIGKCRRCGKTVLHNRKFPNDVWY